MSKDEYLLKKANEEIARLKELILKYEEEHDTVFKQWQKTIKKHQELKEWLEEQIRKSNYELETDAFTQVLERLG